MFLAVADQGSFRSAAKAVFKTQSTVSAAIRTLEGDLGFTLFHRDSYRPTLTARGEAFYHRTRAVVQQVEDLESMGRQLAAGTEPKFHIVINPMCPLNRVLTRLKPIVDGFPHTDFNVATEALSGVLERLDSGNSDIALTGEFGIGAHHEVLPVGRMQLTNVAAPGYFDHPLDRTISRNEVRRYTQIVVRDTGVAVQKISVFVVPGARRWAVDDLNTKKELLLAGLGWGRMPVHLIVDDLASGRLIPIQVRGIPVISTGDMVLIRLRDRAVGPIGERIWREFSDLDQEPAPNLATADP